jgi:hypothetical protein
MFQTTETAETERQRRRIDDVDEIISVRLKNIYSMTRERKNSRFSKQNSLQKLKIV